ncbi:MAG: ImmA/IrrE family metallo-endopeptidase [Clostridiaceae bacterium]
MNTWIDEIVLGLTDKYNTNNIYELCEAMEIKIVKLEPKNILLHAKEAYYYRDFDDNEVIFIRNNLHPLLEQFILKHELGHALCHPDILHAAYTFSNIGKLEKQANYFAFKLSNITLDKVYLNEMTIEQIACYVGIPYEVLKQVAHQGIIDK